jgi:beta-lactamase regulating signal transducer with metallopeptidase domain
MICILYVIALGTCLSLAGLAVERSAPAAWPRRWIWCAVIGLSMIIPPVYQARHRSLITSDDGGSWLQRLSVVEPAMMRAWIIGSVVLLLWGIWEIWRVSRIVRNAKSHAHARVTLDGISVLVTESCGPATVGAWRSNVLIPRWVTALPETLRRYIVCHEEQHRRAHDVTMLFVASIPLILAPWNVALWWQLRRLSLAVELDCDNRVVGALGNPAAYGELLLKVAEAANRGPRLRPGLIGGTTMLERRLTRLLAPAHVSHIQRVLLPAIAVMLLLLALWTPHPVRATHAKAPTAHTAHR